MRKGTFTTCVVVIIKKGYDQNFQFHLSENVRESDFSNLLTVVDRLNLKKKSTFFYKICIWLQFHV